MKSHKGLKRHGMRSYWIRGYIITRDRPWRCWARHERYGAMPMDFFAVKHKSLEAAVRWVRWITAGQNVSRTARKDFIVDPREALRRARTRQDHHAE